MEFYNPPPSPSNGEISITRSCIINIYQGNGGIPITLNKYVKLITSQTRLFFLFFCIIHFPVVVWNIFIIHITVGILFILSIWFFTGDLCIPDSFQ